MNAVCCLRKKSKLNKCDTNSIPSDADLGLNLTRKMLSKERGNDATLFSCFSSAAAPKASDYPVKYYFEDDVLLRSWSPDRTDLRTQIVVPAVHRKHVVMMPF